MKIEKIKPIPKYIVARIKRADKQNNITLPGRTRFYSYLTKNDGEEFSKDIIICLTLIKFSLI